MKLRDLKDFIAGQEALELVTDETDVYIYYKSESFDFHITQSRADNNLYLIEK